MSSIHETRDRLGELLNAAGAEQLARLADNGAKIAALLQAQGATRHSQIMQYAVDRLVEDRIPDYLLTAFNLKAAPPTIEEFLDDEKFWKERMNIWPRLRPEIVKAAPYPFLTMEPKDQWIAGGGTGTGKTATAQTLSAYHLTLLHHMNDPQSLYGLTKDTLLVFAFMATSERVVKDVIYKPFRGMFTSMPWAIEETTWDQNNESELLFSNNLQVKFGLPVVDTIIGQAVISSIIDEANFMAIVQRSKKVAGNRGEGGYYDQAATIVAETVQRRKSRAIGRGPLPGITCVMSSIRYKNDFIDRRQDQVRATNEPGVVLFRARRFEVQPASRFTLGTMKVLVGSERNPTRILTPDDAPGVTYPETALVEDVPEEFRADFTNNPEDALRNILGIASDAISAFIAQRQKITEAMARGKEIGLRSFLVKDNVDYQIDGLPDVNRAFLPTDPETRRFIHVDLSTSSDRCGVAMAKIVGSTQVAIDPNGEGSFFEVLPKIVVEMAVSIQPSKVKELDPADVRLWIMRLREYFGLNIYQVSYDGYKSDESIRQFRKAGVRSKLVSVDTSREPYEHLRRGLYQDRIDPVDNDVLRTELVQLEHDKTSKPEINHPPTGSKDVADAVCGAVFAAASSRMERDSFDVVNSQGVRVTKASERGRRDPVRR